MRIIFFITCVAVGAIASCLAQPYANDNSDVVTILITTYTVFAGFSIAIISIIGDPAAIPKGTWRTAEGRRQRMEQRLNLHVFFFVIYLLTIGLLFIGVLTRKGLPDTSMARIWVERLYLFFGISSFLLTLSLPFALRNIQRMRYETETENRRREVNLPAD